MAIPSRAELLALYESMPDAVVIIDVANDLVTAVNPRARERLGIGPGASPAATSFEGAYLSLSALAAAGLNVPVDGERVTHRGRALDAYTVELPAETEATVAVILRDRHALDAALVEQRIRERLDVAQSIARGLVTRLLDPCVVLSADLEYFEQASQGGALDEVLAEARRGLGEITRTVTALRELALPDDATEAAPLDAAIEAAIALAGPELREFAQIHRNIEPHTTAGASRPLLALLSFHLLWWIGERLRADGHAGTEVRLTTTRHDARVTLTLEHVASPWDGGSADAAAHVLSSMVAAAGGHVSEGGSAGAAWVRIDLPAPHASDGTLKLGRPHVLAAPTLAPRAPSIAPRAQRRHLLLVDDDDIIRTALARLLGNEYEVRAARDARTALEAMEQRLPDVVVSDVAMPGTNGPDLLHMASARWPELARRFVFLTGGGMDVATQRTILAARVPCLLKPVARATLVDAIEELLSGA